jgi:hypothetical protein
MEIVPMDVRMLNIVDKLKSGCIVIGFPIGSSFQMLFNVSEYLTLGELCGMIEVMYERSGLIGGLTAYGIQYGGGAPSGINIRVTIYF